MGARDPTDAEEAFLDAVYDAMEEALEAGIPPGQIEAMLGGAQRWIHDKADQPDP